jgi:hypothetical protein
MVVNRPPTAARPRVAAVSRIVSLTVRSRGPALAHAQRARRGRPTWSGRSGRRRSLWQHVQLSADRDRWRSWLAASAELAPKQASPHRSIRRWPKRSPSAPAVRSTQAKARPYTSRIHSNCVPLGSSRASSDGIATLKTVLSTFRRTVGKHKTPSTTHRRRPAGPSFRAPSTLHRL